VRLRGNGQAEQPAYFRDATFLESRLDSETLRGYHGGRNRTFCHDHESPFTVSMTLSASSGVRTSSACPAPANLPGQSTRRLQQLDGEVAFRVFGFQESDDSAVPVPFGDDYG
jgi:hypothetical protein